ncbi:MAG: glycosyltransferase family 2 protein [Lachnospiraceae bacterium]|nr:glycosyltransferase family 2 protein [Lachnospiraceae bacterium]
MKRDEGKPFFTIVIPVYNTEKYLEECVESVIKQSFQELEIILVDDGSTDSSPLLCDALAKQDERIRVVHKKNGGLSSARNAGIQAAKGQYIGFIDSDDYIHPDMYQKMYDAIRGYHSKIICCGRYDVYSDYTQMGLVPENEEVISYVEGIRSILTWKGMDGSACDKVFESTLFENLSFPEGELNEDVAVMYRLMEKAENIALVPTPFYYYRHRGGSITQSGFGKSMMDSLKHAREILQYMEEHIPELIPEASYYKTKILMGVIFCLTNDEAAKRKEYGSLYKECVSELRQTKKIILRFETGKMAKKNYYKAIMMTIPSLYILYRNVINRFERNNE